MEFLKKLRKDFIKALYPDRCIICRRTLENGYLCSECNSLSLPYDSVRVLHTDSESNTVRICAPYPYEGGYRRTIQRFKFYGAKAYDSCLAGFMADTLPEDIFHGVDLLTFVPMSHRKVRQRGYNQAELLAEKLSDVMGIPCMPVFGKKRENLRQHTLGPEERRLNVKDVFSVTCDIKGQNVLIVDDIITTGCTIEECSRTLLKAGAAKVGAVCAAYADKSGKGQ